jgi:hypothetical protein
MFMLNQNNSSRKTRSSSLSRDNVPNSAPLPPILQAYLDSTLPNGWANWFTGRRAGKWAGLPTQCPHCLMAARALAKRERKTIKNTYHAWRYLTVHMAMCGRRRTKPSGTAH